MNVTRQTIYQGVFRCVPGLLLLLALALAASPTLAGDVTPPTPIDLTANAMLLAGGAGTQTDPHISGALVSYADPVDRQCHRLGVDAEHRNPALPGARQHIGFA